MSLLNVVEAHGLTLWLGSMACWSCIFIITDVRWFWLPQGLVTITAFSNIWAIYAGYVAPYWPVTLGLIAAFTALWRLYPRGLGSGDVTLFAALSLGCDGILAYVVLVVAFSSATLVGTILWALSGRTIFSFGPFLLVGWWLAWQYGKEWLVWLGW